MRHSGFRRLPAEAVPVCEVPALPGQLSHGANGAVADFGISRSPPARARSTGLARACAGPGTLSPGTYCRLMRAVSSLAASTTSLQRKGSWKALNRSLRPTSVMLPSTRCFSSKTGAATPERPGCSSLSLMQ